MADTESFEECHYLEMPGQVAPPEYNVSVLPSAARTSAAKQKPTATTELDMIVALLRIAIADDPTASHYVFNPKQTKDPVEYPTVDGEEYDPPHGITMFIAEADDIRFPHTIVSTKPIKEYNWWQDPGRGYFQSTDAPRDGMHRHSGTVFLSNPHAHCFLSELTDTRITDFKKWACPKSQSSIVSMLEYAIHPLLEAAGVGDQIDHATYVHDDSTDVTVERFPANTYPILTFHTSVKNTIITPLDHDEWPTQYCVNTQKTSTYGAGSGICRIVDIFPWGPNASSWASDQEDPIGSWSLLQVCGDKSKAAGELYVLPCPFGAFTPMAESLTTLSPVEIRAEKQSKDGKGQKLEPARKAAGQEPSSKGADLFAEAPITVARNSKQTVIDVYCGYDPYLNIKARFINTRLHGSHNTSETESASDLVTYDPAAQKYTAKRTLTKGTTLVCNATRLHSMASYADTQRASAAASVHYSVKPSKSFLLRPATHNAPAFDDNMPPFQMECELPKWSTDGTPKATTKEDVTSRDKTAERRFRRYDMYYDTFNAHQEVPLFGIRKAVNTADSNCIAYAVDTTDTSMWDQHAYISLGNKTNQLPRFHPYDPESDANTTLSTKKYTTLDLSIDKQNESYDPPNRLQYTPAFPEYAPDDNMLRPAAHLLITKDIPIGKELLLPDDAAVRNIATYVELNTDMIYGDTGSKRQVQWSSAANSGAIQAATHQKREWQRHGVNTVSNQRRYICLTEAYNSTDIAYSRSEVNNETICYVRSSEEDDDCSTLKPGIVVADYKNLDFGPAQEHDTTISGHATAYIPSYNTYTIPKNKNGGPGSGLYHSTKDKLKGPGLFASRKFVAGETIFTENLNLYSGIQKENYFEKMKSYNGATFVDTYIMLQTREQNNKIIALLDNDCHPSQVFLTNHPHPHEDATCRMVPIFPAESPGMATIEVKVGTA
jgi:hypothetical protein